jgi:Ca2+-binding EF-hand superfamily protein
VTLDEFVDYYTDVSCSIPSDEYFVKMMESTWQCPENEDTENTVKAVKYLVKETRSRLQAATEGDDELISKVFGDYDLNQSGSLTIDEVTAMLAKLQISVERCYVRPFFKVLDRDNSGTVEPEEFEAFVKGN